MPLAASVLSCLLQEGFQDSQQQDGSNDSLGNVNLFVDAWMKYDRNAANCIPISRFVTMMQDAPWPFGLQRPDGSPMTNGAIVHRLKQLNIPVYVVPLYKLRRQPPRTRRPRDGGADSPVKRAESPVRRMLSPSAVEFESTGASTPPPSPKVVPSWLSWLPCLGQRRNRRVVDAAPLTPAVGSLPSRADIVLAADGSTVKPGGKKAKKAGAVVSPGRPQVGCTL